jgi:predicted metalloprotease with PDZ domain
MAWDLLSTIKVLLVWQDSPVIEFGFFLHDRRDHMKQVLLFLLLIAMLSVSRTVSSSTKPTLLGIHIIQDEAGYKAIDISLTFYGEADGETIIELPNEWGGQRELYKAVRDLRAEYAAISSDATTPNLRTLKHAPSARIVLHYRIVSDTAGPVFDGSGNDYRALIKPDLIFALGEATIVRPANISNDSPATVQITGFKNEDSFASDLEHGKLGRELSFGDLIESVLIGGNIRIIDAGHGARLAIRGKVDQRDDEGWKQSFIRIASAQRAYWNTKNEPFLVTVMTQTPSMPGSSFIGGTGRSDAFAFFATTNSEPFTLDKILSHEMAHTWTPRRIGGLRSEPNEAGEYWLSEGFTDWVSWRVAVRSGQWSAQEFIEAFNEQIKAYDLSPVREALNTRIMADFWNDADVDKLPYQRGMLLATFWDQQVRARTGGKKNFDHVLWQMQKDALKKPKSGAVELLSIALKKVAHIDNYADLAQYVEQGKAVEFNNDVFAPCGQLEWVQRKTFHRGFDIKATQANNNIVKGVVVNGPAWQSGLRDGMKLIGRSGGEIGNSTVEIIYDVMDKDSRRSLHWLPEGEGMEKYRVLRKNNTPSQAELLNCKHRLGGP